MVWVCLLCFVFVLLCGCVYCVALFCCVSLVVFIFVSFAAWCASSVLLCFVWFRLVSFRFVVFMLVCGVCGVAWCWFVLCVCCVVVWVLAWFALFVFPTLQVGVVRFLY